MKQTQFVTSKLCPEASKDISHIFQSYHLLPTSCLFSPKQNHLLYNLALCEQYSCVKLEHQESVV